MRALTGKEIDAELMFTSSRSSGAGGQSVNKVNSKVTLRWDIKNSKLISSEQKDLLRSRLARQLTTDGELIITSQEHRSQLQNRNAVVQKLNAILAHSFKKKKTRKSSKPTKASIQKRLEGKRRQSEKKKFRGRIN